jgi:undecaprenyl-diphosphatase
VVGRHARPRYPESLISTFQAVVLGVLQGATELFPVSSLGHTVLLPTLFGWGNVVAWQSQSESPRLAFVVMLHVGSAIGLLIYFWRDWIALIGAFSATVKKRRIETPTERLAWLRAGGACGMNREGGRRLDTLDFREATVIGTAQSSALIAGISRDGVVMTAGLARGLDNADAARYGFLLATPPILAAGVYKLHDLTGPNGTAVRGPAVIAAVAAAITAVITLRFFTRTSGTAT